VKSAEIKKYHNRTKTELY